MSTHNICFYGEISKIITYLSPNTLICSTDNFSVTSEWVFEGMRHNQNEGLDSEGVKCATT